MTPDLATIHHWFHVQGHDTQTIANALRCDEARVSLLVALAREQRIQQNKRLLA